jgi:hypothetical protein
MKDAPQIMPKAPILSQLSVEISCISGSLRHERAPAGDALSR